MFNYCIINIEYLLSLKTLTMLMYKKLIKLNIDIKDDEYIESYQLLLTIKKLKSIILTHSPDLIELDNIVG
jgi:spore coat protein CotH